MRLSFYRSIVLSFYRSIVLSFYRSIVLSFYRSIVLSFYRSIVLSFYRSIVLSFYRSIVLSFYRSIVLSFYRSIVLSFYRSIVLSFYRSIVLSFYRSIVLSFYRSIVLSFYRSIVLSFYRSIVLSFYRSIVLSFYRSIVLSFYRSIVLSFYRSIVLSFYRSIVLSFYRSIVRKIVCKKSYRNFCLFFKSLWCSDKACLQVCLSYFRKFWQSRKEQEQKKIKNSCCFLRSRFFDFRGFGLVESVIVAGVGMTLGLGMLKLTQVSINTAQVSGTILAEQRLKRSIYSLLSQPAECAFNLKPSRLSDKTNKKGTIASLIKTGGDEALITSGESFADDLIDIVKMELIDPDTTNSNSKERTFKVYYKKPRLAEFSTISGKACSATDSSGCYTISCKMEYHCKNVDGNCDDDEEDLSASPKVYKDTCQPLDCLGNSGRGGIQGLDLAGRKCGDKELFRGLKADGTADCVPLSCKGGAIFIGIKVEEDPQEGTKKITPVCVKVANEKCKDSESVIITYSPEASEPFDVDCEKVCPGRMSYQSGACKCPVGTQFNVSTSICE